MRSAPDRDQLFEEALSRIAQRPPNEGLELVLHYFLGMVKGMDLQAARAMSEQLANRFGGRYCSSELCATLADLVNGHLATREEEAQA